MAGRVSDLCALIADMEWITLGQLAREQQINDRDMFDKARELGIPATRMAAKLRPQQADTLRRRLLTGLPLVWSPVHARRSSRAEERTNRSI